MYVFQPLEACGNWPWNSRQSGGHADKRFRYTLLSVDVGPETTRCIGYARRRKGRGGRVIFDRAYPEQRTDFWDRVFDAGVHTNSELEEKKTLEVNSFPPENTFQDYVEKSKW